MRHVHRRRVRGRLQQRHTLGRVARQLQVPQYMRHAKAVHGADVCELHTATVRGACARNIAKRLIVTANAEPTRRPTHARRALKVAESRSQVLGDVRGKSATCQQVAACVQRLSPRRGMRRRLHHLEDRLVYPAQDLVLHLRLGRTHALDVLEHLHRPPQPVNVISRRVRALALLRECVDGG